MSNKRVYSIGLFVGAGLVIAGVGIFYLVNGPAVPPKPVTIRVHSVVVGDKSYINSGPKLTLTPEQAVRMRELLTRHGTHTNPMKWYYIGFANFDYGSDTVTYGIFHTSEPQVIYKVGKHYYYGGDAKEMEKLLAEIVAGEEGTD